MLMGCRGGRAGPGVTVRVQKGMNTWWTSHWTLAFALQACTWADKADHSPDLTGLLQGQGYWEHCNPLSHKKNSPASEQSLYVVQNLRALPALIISFNPYSSSGRWAVPHIYE